jgi:hypothetical protein
MIAAFDAASGSRENDLGHRFPTSMLKGPGDSLDGSAPCA